MSKKSPESLSQDLSALLDGECSLSRQCKVFKALSEEETVRKEFEAMQDLSEACRDALKNREHEASPGLWDHISIELREMSTPARTRSLELGDMVYQLTHAVRVSPGLVTVCIGFFVFAALGFVVDFDSSNLVALLFR